MSSNGKDHTSTIGSPGRSADAGVADIAPTVMVVLCGVLPERLDGAKLQLHPRGSPEQANDRAVATPLVGVMVSIRVPGFALLALKALAESDSV